MDITLKEIDERIAALWEDIELERELIENYERRAVASQRLEECNNLIEEININKEV